MSLMTTALILAWVAIVLLTLAVAGLMRQVHLLLTERADAGADGAVGTAVGGPALPPDLADDGVILFASTSCVACFEVLPVLVEHCAGGDATCTVVTEGPRHDDWPEQLRYREHAGELFEQFAVVATPHALVVRNGAVAESAPVGSPEALRRLLARVRPTTDSGVK